MKKRTTKQIGDFGEQRAVNYLRLRGYTVKERNYRAGHYEIDIIASRFSELAFVEVKTRTYDDPSTIDLMPPPSNAVKRDKQRFTRQAAKQYLYENPSNKKPRMDVIEVWLLKQPNGKKPKVWRIRHMKGVY
ncbi:MAG: YraN family protein [Clostridia bacterium]|nr:YraN family protein [Clostridia bacterium]